MTEIPILRVARPTDNLAAIAAMYRAGLGLIELAAFKNHDGFDGVILGRPGAPYHLEFTQHRGSSAGSAPHPDQLLVFYLPNEADWQASCARIRAAGFRDVKSLNPYWDVAGRTFEDIDGFRVVLQRAKWIAVEEPRGQDLR